MGTLQSFTPLPQNGISLYLLNPSKGLIELIQNKQFKQEYKFKTQIINKFPLTQLLQYKNKSSSNKIKIIIQEQHLIDICHFALIFHHQIVIITKDNNNIVNNTNNQNENNKQLRFKDININNTNNKTKNKIYTPIQIQCLKYCPSIDIKQLQHFIDNQSLLKHHHIQHHHIQHHHIQHNQKQHNQKQHINHINNNNNQIHNIIVQQNIPSHQKNIIQSITQTPPITKQQQLNQKNISKIKINNYKRRSTQIFHRQRYQSKSILPKLYNQFIQTNNNIHNQLIKVPHTLLTHHSCPFNPISLILSHISHKMTKKILNLLKFYQSTYIRYPSLEIFLSSCCNSNKIVCGPTQLQQISKKVQTDEYPFRPQTKSTFSILSSSSLGMLQNDSMHMNHQSQNILPIIQSQDITLYCFCNDAFQNNFKTNSAKLIGILKDKLIQIKFFKNLIQLIKQLFKDQNIDISTEIFNQILKQKAYLLSNKKLRSVRDNGDQINQTQGQNYDKVIQNSAENDSKSASSNQMINSNLLTGKFIKKDSFSWTAKNAGLLPKFSSKHINALNKASSSNIIPLASIKGIPGSIPSLAKQSYSIIPKQDRSLFSYMNSTIYFVMHQKQKDRYSIQSLPKKISRYLKNIKVKKVLSLQYLVDKIKHQYVSVVIINDNPKILQQFYTLVELNAIQDKIIVIKRQQSQTYQTLVKKINQVRQIGLVKLQKFYSFSYIGRKIIVMGSKSFLKHIFNQYPYLDIKEFIDITIYKEHRKIREVITRKNQLIVSNVAICQTCNLQYKGLIKAKIIYYQPKIQTQHIFTAGGRGDCKCMQSDKDLKISMKLNNMLDSFSCPIGSYPYMNKKMYNCSSQIAFLFTKIKEKKNLTNFEDFSGNSSDILFLCSDSWIIQQITMILVKLFSNRYSSIWLSAWMTKKIVYDCIRQTQEIVKFHVESAVSIYKGQLTTKVIELIEQSQQIYKKLSQSLEYIENIFQLSEVLLQLFIQNCLFRRSINYIWKNLLGLNKHEYPLQCCTVFMVLILGFRKSSAMKRNDSINDGTFKSFRVLKSQTPNKNENLSISYNNDSKDKITQNQMSINGSLQKFNKSLGASLILQDSNSSFFSSVTNENHMNMKTDGIVEQSQNKCIKNHTPPKIYLKLANFQKSSQDQSLRKFFISKNNAFSYIYTTEFLVFQMIDQQQIEGVITNYCNQRQKTLHQANKKIVNTFSPQKFHHSQTKYHDYKSEQAQKYSKKNNVGSPCPQQFSKPPIPQKNNFQMPLSPLISSLLSMGQQQSRSNSITNSQHEDLPLELKSCKNIAILPSTQDSLIICIQNIELLNYNIFMPFYRSSSALKNKDKKHFIIPPLTKLQINNNYSTLNTINNSGSSLITHQLKLSPEHQQRFLQKILQTFLVQKSQYYDELHLQKKVQIEKSFEMDSSKLFAENQPIQEKDNQNNKFTAQSQNYEDLFVLKSPSKLWKKRNTNPWDQIRLIDQKFKLPYTDQFFILMNQFKYFSAHHLIISYLPKTNMTNAYHSILLCRKGLYQQALDILIPSNPFKFTIEEYINELRNRMVINNQINEPQNSRRKLQVKRKVMTWKVSYSSKEQKFYVKQKTDSQLSFCYNDDSLDVIYKQVMGKIQKKIDYNYDCQSKGVQNNANLDAQNSNDPQIMTGTFVNNNNKSPQRKAKKQSSIAIFSNERQNTLNNSRTRDLSQIGNGISTISRRSAVKMSLRSRDSILNDMRFFQQIQAINTNANSSLISKKRSRVSYNAESSFMFGNSQPNQSLNMPLNRQSQLSYQKQPYWKKVPAQINVDEQIEEKSSSSSQKIPNKSDDDESHLKIIRAKCKKVTPVNVRTRNKSQFFVENISELKKSAQYLKLQVQKQKNASNKFSIDRQMSDENQNSQKYLTVNEFDINQHQSENKVEQTRSLVQNVMIEDNQQIPELSDKQMKTLKSHKVVKSPLLFKQFEIEKLQKNDSWLTQKNTVMIDKKQLKSEKLQTKKQTQIVQIKQQFIQDKKSMSNDNQKEDEFIKFEEQDFQIKKIKSIPHPQKQKSHQLNTQIKPVIQIKLQEGLNKDKLELDLSDQNPVTIKSIEYIQNQIDSVTNKITLSEQKKNSQDVQRSIIDQFYQNSESQSSLLLKQKLSKKQQNSIFHQKIDNKNIKQNQIISIKSIISNGMIFKKLKSNSSSSQKLQHHNINKVKCKLTLDLSSESSDQQTLELITKQQTDQQSQIDQSIRISNHLKVPSQNLQVYKQKQIKNNRKIPNSNPYKLFSKLILKKSSNSSQQKNSSIQNSSKLSSSSSSQLSQKQNNFINQNRNSLNQQNKKSIFNFTFKKKKQDTTILQSVQQKKQTQNSQLHQNNFIQQCTENNFLQQSNKNQSTNQRNSLINSQSSSQQQKSQKDHQQFLRSHTSLMLWHQQHQQTQKHLKSSKKLLKSSKQMITHKNLQNNQLNVLQTQEESKQTLQEPIIINQRQKIRKQKNRSDQNSFTFMKPSVGPENKPVTLGYQPKQIDAESQHISDFHSRLMNNSSICILDPTASLSPFLTQDNFFSKKHLSTKGVRPSKLRYVCQQTKREQGLKASYQQKLGSNQQRFNIIVKTMNIVQDDQDDKSKKSSKQVRKSAQDYNHQKQNISDVEKLNQSSDKPLNDKQKNKKRDSYDSWYDQSNKDQQEMLKNYNYLNPNKNKQKFENKQNHNNSCQQQRLSTCKNRRNMIRQISIGCSRQSLQQSGQVQDIPQQTGQFLKVKGYNVKKESQMMRRSMDKVANMQKAQAKNMNVKSPNNGQEYGGQQYKVHPQQLIYLSPMRGSVMYKKQKIRRVEQIDEQQLYDNESRLNMMSLGKLRLNCDIRRKR